MRRGKGLRPRSRRMEVTYRERRRLVAALLAEFPVCQRCGAARSVDVHELLSRGRGGSILDPANCRAVCRACHDWIGRNVAEAEATGWLLRSGFVALPVRFCAACTGDRPGRIESSGFRCAACDHVTAVAS